MQNLEEVVPLSVAYDEKKLEKREVYKGYIKNFVEKKLLKHRRIGNKAEMLERRVRKRNSLQKKGTFQGLRKISDRPKNDYEYMRQETLKGESSRLSKESKEKMESLLSN